MLFNIGDSVVVKQGYHDEDTGEDMSGWQGRIDNTPETVGDNFYSFTLDSITLDSLSDEYIVKIIEDDGSVEWGFAPENMLEPAQPRDTEEEVAEVLKDIKYAYHWYHFWEDSEGKRIIAIIDIGKDPGDFKSDLTAWQLYLKKSIKFPVQCAYDADENDAEEDKDWVWITGIAGKNDEEGLLADTEDGRVLPLWLCEPAKPSKFKALCDYKTWFEYFPHSDDDLI